MFYFYSLWVELDSSQTPRVEVNSLSDWFLFPPRSWFTQGSLGSDNSREVVMLVDMVVQGATTQENRYTVGNAATQILRSLTPYDQVCACVCKQYRQFVRVCMLNVYVCVCIFM